jgi:hypothetical protein
MMFAEFHCWMIWRDVSEEGTSCFLDTTAMAG